MKNEKLGYREKWNESEAESHWQCGTFDWLDDLS